jgi:hypothetical protein
MTTEPEQPKSRKGVSGVAIPAGLFIGMGVGFLIDELVAGLFIGLGAGFLVMLAIRLYTGEW